ncbi:MAG: TIGR01212 family radical SAM protein [Bacillota bacterium]
MKRYYKYSDYLINKYGVKTYKLPVNLPLTCPNRDGYLGKGGCDYCGEDGAAFGETAHPESVSKQILELKEPIGKKYNAEKFIAYFQNFTNTYLPLSELKKYIKEAVKIDDIVEIAISTRPDCINEKYIKTLQKITGDVNLTIELGLQTVNYHTLININRKHTLAEYIDAVLTCRKYGVELVTHLILNLPGDEMTDVIENSKIISAFGIDTIKLHALYIKEKTVMAKKFKNNEIEIISLSEYVNRVVTFLEYLAPDIAIQRLIGRAPEEKTLFVNWGYSWAEINNKIINKLKEKDSYQGKKFNYLKGKALLKFEEEE